MRALKIDHVYLSVKNLKRAIAFYEKLLGLKVKHKFENRWADFEDNGFYLGLYNPTYDGEKVKWGDNAIVGFYTNDIVKEHERIKKLGPTTITEIFNINFFMPYKYFQVEDSEGIH